jgi:hypothetical protein
MTNRERFCTQMMYFCFAAGAVVLIQGLTPPQPTTAQNPAPQNPAPPNPAPPNQPVAHRGSGRIALRTN